MSKIRLERPWDDRGCYSLVNLEEPKWSPPPAGWTEGRIEGVRIVSERQKET